MQASSSARSDFMQLFLLQTSDREERRLEKKRIAGSLKNFVARKFGKEKKGRSDVKNYVGSSRKDVGSKSSVRTNVDKRPERIQNANKCSGHCSRNKGYVYTRRLIISN